jgi:hypothetical protein
MVSLSSDGSDVGAIETLRLEPSEVAGQVIDFMVEAREGKRRKKKKSTEQI